MPTLQGGKVPTRLPAGWEHESAVFGEGELAQGATSAGLQMLIGALLLALALALAWPRAACRHGRKAVL
jgi:hypothetical protein